MNGLRVCGRTYGTPKERVCNATLVRVVSKTSQLIDTGVHFWLQWLSVSLVRVVAAGAGGLVLGLSMCRPISVSMVDAMPAGARPMIEALAIGIVIVTGIVLGVGLMTEKVHRLHAAATMWSAAAVLASRADSWRWLRILRRQNVLTSAGLVLFALNLAVAAIQPPRLFGAIADPGIRSIVAILVFPILSGAWTVLGVCAVAVLHTSIAVAFRPVFTDAPTPVLAWWKRVNPFFFPRMPVPLWVSFAAAIGFVTVTSLINPLLDEVGQKTVFVLGYLCLSAWGTWATVHGFGIERLYGPFSILGASAASLVLSAVIDAPELGLVLSPVVAINLVVALVLTVAALVDWLAKGRVRTTQLLAEAAAFEVGQERREAQLEARWIRLAEWVSWSRSSRTADRFADRGGRLWLRLGLSTSHRLVLMDPRPSFEPPSSFAHAESIARQRGKLRNASEFLNSDHIVLFAASLPDLRAGTTAIAAMILDRHTIWVCFRRGGSRSLPVDWKRAYRRGELARANLQFVRDVRIDADWHAVCLRADA